MKEKIIAMLKNANNDTPYDFKKDFTEILKLKIKDKYFKEFLSIKKQEE